MPDCNWFSRRGDSASRLLGSARTTTRSVGSRSGRTVRAACRSLRATRCLMTAFPTDFATIKPIWGAVPDSARTACTTRSGCGARTPHLTVWVNSADRVIRLRAGSTGTPTGRSGSQRATALAAPTGHDGPTGTGPHPQPETVNSCPTPVVRLEGALALGHGCLSSSHLRRSVAAETDSAAAALVAKFHPNRRGPGQAGRCRATRGWETLPRVLRSHWQVKPHWSHLSVSCG